ASGEGGGEADVGVDPVDEHAEGIGQDDLLHQPPQDEECAALDGLQAYAAGGFDLRPEQAPATDRSCDELREEGDVERVFPERVARRGGAGGRDDDRAGVMGGGERGGGGGRAGGAGGGGGGGGVSTPACS